MTLILDTRQIPAADRGDAVRETIARTVVHVNIDFPPASGPEAFGAITDVGQVKVCSVLCVPILPTALTSGFALPVTRP